VSTERSTTRGALYLIPNLLGEVQMDSSLPPLVAATVRRLTHFLVEEEKNARHFIKRLCPELPIRDLSIARLNEHTRQDAYSLLAAPLKDGIDIGIISDAGCPAIADPGAEIVRIAHAWGARVYPLVGPCSMILALMGSGFNGQRWRFSGYLPVEDTHRRSAILALEKDLYDRDETQLFMDTPYRTHKVFQELLSTCRPETGLCIASGLTTGDQSILMRSIEEWRAITTPLLPRTPTVFVLGR
jgi:16S rRNA (cytidine1402-2'-O)-methyltransferase